MPSCLWILGSKLFVNVRMCWFDLGSGCSDRVAFLTSARNYKRLIFPVKSSLITFGSMVWGRRNAKFIQYSPLPISFTISCILLRLVFFLMHSGRRFKFLNILWRISIYKPFSNLIQTSFVFYVFNIGLTGIKAAADRAIINSFCRLFFSGFLKT